MPPRTHKRSKRVLRRKNLTGGAYTVKSLEDDLAKVLDSYKQVILQKNPFKIQMADEILQARLLDLLELLHPKVQNDTYERFLFAHTLPTAAMKLNDLAKE